MITDGKPGYLPWTDASAIETAQAICKPLAGGAWLSSGRALAKAIGACRGCCFAALDVRTGYLLASASLNVRDDVLALMERAEARMVYWFATSAGVRPSHARFTAFEDASTWPCPARSFGEQLSLGERVNAFLAREDCAIERGFALWFAGSGSLRVPGITGPLNVTLPAFALYGVFSAPGGADLQPGLDSLAAELLTVSGGVAMAADRGAFTEALPWFQWPNEDPRHAARRSWLTAVIGEAGFESGNVPWIEAAKIESGATFAATEPLPVWTEETGEQIEALSQFGSEQVTVELT